MKTKFDYDVTVKNEEIVIHPTSIATVGDSYLVEARVIGTVEIRGNEYEFNTVIRVKADRVQKE